MKHVAYIHVYPRYSADTKRPTLDRQTRQDLVQFFESLHIAEPKGLLQIHPVVTRSQLEKLAAECQEDYPQIASDL